MVRVMLTCRVDTRTLESKLKAMATATPRAAESAVRIMAREVMAEVVTAAPRDTGRFVRGWAQANNAAGLPYIPVPPLNRASRHEQILRRLQKQVSWWNFVVSACEKQGRRDKWYTKAQNKLERAKEEVRKFADTPGEAVIAINLRGSARFEGGMTTVRNKVYGGEGSIDRVGTQVFVRLHNREPHASIVESRTHVLGQAQRRLKGAGLRRVRPTLAQKLKEASGFAA